MSLITNNTEYYKLLDCVVDPKLQTDVTAQKLHNIAIKSILPASKPTQVKELQETAQTYRIMQEQFSERSQGRVLLADAADKLEKRATELAPSHAVLAKLNKEWKNEDELWEMLTLANTSLKNDPSLELFISPTLLRILQSVKTMRKELSAYLDKYIESLLRKYDIATNGKFSSLLATYGYLDLRVSKSEIISAIVKKQLSLCIDPAGMEKQFREDMRTEVHQHVKNNCLPAYDWLKDNCSALVTPYNHGNEDFEVGGCCHQNSCARQALLLKNPTLATKDIPLGSTEKTRSIRAKLNQAPQVVNNKLSLAESYAPFGSPFGIKLEKIEDLKQVEDLSEFLQKHSEPFMLRFQQNDVGHVINVQCDPKNKIYRFIDDGIGSVAYTSREELSKQLVAYLKTFYPGWEDYRARFTTLMEPNK